ncbi:MAG: hypothetical protein L0241_00475 [Planctomycetia bacterium]|nr:hypothetical protein [Planctomycetia bacterium]
MAHILCEVTDGLRPAEATVAVRDYTGRTEYLPVDRGLLARANGKYLLPVHMIYQDQAKGAALVQLPDEADSGTSRIWVRLADIVVPEVAS